MKKQEYKIAMRNGKELTVETRSGYCFHLGDGLDVGLTRDRTGTCWIASELSTGAKIMTGATIDKTLAAVLSAVHRMGAESFRRARASVMETLKANGIAFPINADVVPRYYFLTSKTDAELFGSIEDVDRAFCEYQEEADEEWMKTNDPAAYIIKNDLYDSAVALMDEEIREELHNELAPCSDREFLEAYIERHEEKYGSPFIFN